MPSFARRGGAFGVLCVCVMLAVSPVVAAKVVGYELHLRRVQTESTIEAAFLQRSVPGEALFREHLDMNGLMELVAPRAESRAAVEGFLSSTEGVEGTKWYTTLDVVRVDVREGSAAAAELGSPSSRLVEEHLSKVVRIRRRAARRAISSNQEFPTTPGMSTGSSSSTASSFVPSSSASTTATGATGTDPSDDNSSEYPGTTQTPLSIARRYNVPLNASLAGQTAVSQGLSAMQPSGAGAPIGFSQTMLATFLEQYHLPVTKVGVKGTASVRSSSGTDKTAVFGNTAGQGLVEYMTAMAPGAPTWWIEGNGTWAEWCDSVMSMRPHPAVVVVTASETEYSFIPGTPPARTTPQTSTTTPVIPSIPAEMAAAEDAFRKLGLLGITVVATSGTEGPGRWGPVDEYEGRAKCGTLFGPSYPSSSQYVTSVGTTYANATTETADRWSGGGFSEFIERPSWQSNAVEKYLVKANLPPSTMYNASGRAYPDISAIGVNVEEVAATFTDFSINSSYSTWSIEGKLAPGAGGMAAPTFAAIITQIAGIRAAKGLPRLGFLAPSLYGMASVGYDVTTGQSGNDCYVDPRSSISSTTWGSTTSSTAHGLPPVAADTATAVKMTNNEEYGFPAVPGWDAATGLGTPDFNLLLKALV